MDVAFSPSLSTLQTVKERIRGKINGSLKTAKLQTSLAAKIKAKSLNNSSFLKVSLKHNNKALACALTAERQNSRRLENDKMFLQKEVKMLHFQNSLLRQNLSIVNTMLKDIDVFMNINLPAAIEISSTMEPLDLPSSDKRKSRRSSFQRAHSLGEDQGFRLTGMALRVPSSSGVQQTHNRVQGEVVLSEDHPLFVSPSTNSHIGREKSDQQASTELNSFTFNSKESLSTYTENTSRDSLCNARVDDEALLLDEGIYSSSRKAQSDRYVTTRRKRSTISRSSAQSMKSDVGASRERCHSTQWEINTSAAVIPNSSHTGICDETGLHFAQGTNIPSKRSCSFSQFETLDADQNCGLKKETYNFTPIEQVAVTASNFGGQDQTLVDRSEEEEKTVYEADMEMTSSNSAAIVAIVSNNKTKKIQSRSNIHVKQDGISLRKVKQSVREKSKKKNILCDPKSIHSSKIKDTFETAIESNENTTPWAKLAENLNLSPVSEQYDYRRTYVLPGPVMLMNNDVLESTTHSDPVSEMVTVRESTKQAVSDNNNIALQSGLCELSFPLEQHYNAETSHSTRDAASVEKGERKSHKRTSKNIDHSKKKKRKINTHSIDLKHLGKDKDNNTNVSLDNLDNNRGISVADNCHIKNHVPQIRRETYIVSSPITSEFISKDQIHYRRETFVIPKPNYLASIANKTIDLEEKSFSHPLNDFKALVTRDFCPETENGSDLNKAYSTNGHLHPVQDEGCDKSNDYRIENLLKCSEKGTSRNFSQLDKNTFILPFKEDDLDKGTLVRESSVNLSSVYNNKSSKILNTILTNKNDSFMLDMVSESILDETLESPSCVEFPSSTNPESLFNVTLNTTPPLELPGPKDCNRELSYAAKSFNVLDENVNGKVKDQSDTNNIPHCKTENQTMKSQEPGTCFKEIGPDQKSTVTVIGGSKCSGSADPKFHTDNKPFQDLTNKVFGSTKQSPKSCSEEDDSQANSRRRRNPVNYKEPSLTSKLRR